MTDRQEKQSVKSSQETEQQKEELKIEEYSERKVEKDIKLPWEEKRREILKETLLEKYKPRIELKSENQKVINGFLIQKIEEEYLKLAEELFKEHPEILKGKPREELTAERKISFALEYLRGKEEYYRQKERYKKYYDNLDNLSALIVDMEDGSLSPEAQFSTLKLLSEEIERTDQKIKEMQARGKSLIEIETEQNRLESWVKAQQELATKALGRNLEKEVEEKIGPKEKYVEDQTRLEEKKKEIKKIIENEQILKYFKENWEGVSEEDKKTKYNNDPLLFANREIIRIWGELDRKGVPLIKRETYLALLNQGYNPEKITVKGLLRKRIEINGKKFSKKEFSKFLEAQEKASSEKMNEEIEKRAKKELETEYKNLVTEEIKKKIKEIVSSPEMAEVKIKELYQNLKNELLIKTIHEFLKEEKPKTAPQLEEIQEKFAKRGKDAGKLLRNAYYKTPESLRTLTGEVEQDIGNITAFLEEYIETTNEDVKRAMEKITDPDKYKREVKRKIGFVELIIKIVFQLFETKR